MALIEGHNKAYESGASPDSGPSWASSALDDEDYDPRFPMASRGDVMASPEELMGLGMQYSRE